VEAHEYLLIIHPDEDGGFWTEVPALPGCGSQGETVDEAIEMTKDAIQAFWPRCENTVRRRRRNGA
jgi:antitoxin HicB